MSGPETACSGRRPRRAAAFVLTAATLSALAPFPAPSFGRSDLPSARAELSAARDALAAATAEFRTMRSRGDLSPTETADFRAYIDRLERAVVSECLNVMDLKRRLGEAGPEPGCDPGEAAPPGPVSFPGERTQGERTAELERELGASLSAFDELLLREMEALERRRSGSPDSARGAEGAEGAGPPATGALDAAEDAADPAPAGGGPTAQDQARAADGPPGGDGRSAGEPAQGARETAETGSGGPQPADEGGDSGGAEEGSAPAGRGEATLPAEDEDIVARQLREAAERETDPELKEKLWQEYRRYRDKQAVQSKNLN